MGSGDRILYGVDTSVWGLAITFSRFPFSFTISVIFLCFYGGIGFGKGYDE